MKQNKIKTVLMQLDEIPLPDKEKILSACSERSGDFIAKKRKTNRRPHKLIAACVALVLVFGSLSTMFVLAEQAEYNKALDFFNDHNIQTDGFSRDDIKSIYRDISTKNFNKTKQPI